MHISPSSSNKIITNYVSQKVVIQHKNNLKSQVLAALIVTSQSDCDEVCLPTTSFIGLQVSMVAIDIGYIYLFNLTRWY